MQGKTVQIVDNKHPFYGLYCVVVNDYKDGHLRCLAINGGSQFNVLAKQVALVVGVDV